MATHDEYGDPHEGEECASLTAVLTALLLAIGCSRLLG